MAFSRNVESQGLWIQRWITGLVTQRSALFTPISAMGLQFVSRMDALIDGLNMEISQIMTLVRRPAYTRFSNTAFGAGDIPLNYFSFQNTSGTIYPLADTTNKVYNFSPTSNASVLTKSGGAGRGDFIRVGDYVYYCNGVDTKFWDGTTWRNWGITAPSVTPTLTYSAGSLNPTSGYSYVYCYVDSTTGHVSAASVPSVNSGPRTATNITVHYTASTDPQVDQIWIFRIADGGGIYYFLADVANATSTYTDSTLDAGLNNLVVAPLLPNNAPCPAGANLACWWDGRPWVAVKNLLYWAVGPQTITGVGEQSFNTSFNFFKLPINVTGFAPTSNGLLVFTNDTIWIVTGTKGVYFINPFQYNLGIANPNAVAQDGDLVFFVTTRGQCFSLSDRLTEIGQPIRQQIALMLAANVSIAIHRNGGDEGFFVSDGATNIFRFSMTFNCWSPKAQPVQGAGVIKSIETSNAVWTLLLGSPTAAKYIGGRNLSSWTDDGGTYTCYSTVGSIVIGPPGSKNLIDAVYMNVTNTGTYPTISVLLNEISASGGIGFSTLFNPVPEPANLAGTQYESFTVLTKRHDLKAGKTQTGQPLPQLVQHMQVKIAFPAENFGSEVLGMGIK